MQGRTTTKRHWVTRKRRKIWKWYEKADYKEPKEERINKAEHCSTVFIPNAEQAGMETKEKPILILLKQRACII